MLWSRATGVTVGFAVYHRIIEWLRLQDALKGHLDQPPCNEQGHLQLDQVAQSPVQPDLECFREWGIYHLSRQLAPVFHHPHCKKFLPYNSSDIKFNTHSSLKSENFCFFSFPFFFCCLNWVLVEYKQRLSCHP